MWYLFPNNRIERKVKSLVASVLVMVEILVLTCGLTGCGRTVAEVPELLEPVSNVDTFRPVSKRIVGQIQMFRGEVVPVEYPVFASKGVSISEVRVGVGDHVEKGDVVACGTTDILSEQIEALEGEIAALQRKRTNVINISDERQVLLGLEKNVEEYLQDAAGIDSKSKEISVEQENQRYELAVIDAEIDSKRSSITELRSKMEDTTFVASHSGVVTFVKDMSKTNFVEGNENIVVVSDYDDLYVETIEVGIDKYIYESYESKWAFIDGKQLDVVERKYTNEEVSYARSVKKNPPMAFDIPGAKLTMGSVVMLFFMDGDNSPKLTVGMDSLNYDNGEYSVYVKSENGTNEKRVVEVGATDGEYAEVKSGVSEGELVFYRNSALLPKSKEMAEVTIEDYIEESSTRNVVQAYPYYDIHISDITGKYFKLHDRGPASAGDALFSVKSEVTSAEVEEARLAVVKMDTERVKANREYESSRSNLEWEKSVACTPGDAMRATDTDAIRENLYLAERKQCEINILDYEEDYESKDYVATRGVKQKEYNRLKKGTTKGEDRTDYVEYASQDGNLETVIFNSEEKLERGTFVMSEGLKSEKSDSTILLALAQSESGYVGVFGTARIGTSVTLKNGDKNWTGKCIGINGSDERFCLFTQDDKQYSTVSKPFSKDIKSQFLVELDADITDEDMHNAELFFNSEEMKGVVVVPSSAVKTEVSQLNEEVEKHYVWKMENGEMVKEYVTIYGSKVASGKTYILNGLNPGDQVLR